MQLSMSGKGNAAARGGIAGDLLILIEEQEHEHLTGMAITSFTSTSSAFPMRHWSNDRYPYLDGKARIKIEPAHKAEK